MNRHTSSRVSAESTISLTRVPLRRRASSASRSGCDELDFVVAIGSDQQEVARLTAANQVLDQTQGGGVDPLQIVEKHHQRVLGPGEYAQERAKDHLKAVARVLRREIRHRRLFADHQLQFGNETR